MPTSSLDSVKILYTNKSKIKNQIESSFRQIVEKHPEIKKVILFGSFATEKYCPHSDVDILLILDSCEQPFLDRIPIYLPDDLSIPVDVFPYTFSEIDTMIRADNLFIKRVIQEGEVLYDCCDSDKPGFIEECSIPSNKR